MLLKQHTFTRRSTSFCCVTIVFVLPHNQLCVSFSMSSCWSGKYGWKKASYNGNISTKSGASRQVVLTLPKRSKGSPTYAIMLL